MNQIEEKFKLFLADKAICQENATGLTQEDYKYGIAEKARRAHIDGYVYVRFDGKEYGPVKETFGPLDGSTEKATALINARKKDGANQWIKLEYPNIK